LTIARQSVPDFAALHPGYELNLFSFVTRGLESRVHAEEQRAKSCETDVSRDASWICRVKSGNNECGGKHGPGEPKAPHPPEAHDMKIVLDFIPTMAY
jgi:hypothetical protein